MAAAPAATISGCAGKTPVSYTHLIEREREVRHSCDHAEAILLSSEFHLLAAQMADNDVLAGILKSLISRTSLILAQHSTHKETDCSVDEHTAILQALRSRKPRASAAAFVQHLQQVFERANIGQVTRPKRDLSEVLSRYA